MQDERAAGDQLQRPAFKGSSEVTTYDEAWKELKIEGGSTDPFPRDV
jgi:hypothetical protein